MMMMMMTMMSMSSGYTPC